MMLLNVIRVRILPEYSKLIYIQTIRVFYPPYFVSEQYGYQTFFSLNAEAVPRLMLVDHL